ncbi:cholesterol 25-hydroxylase-like protein 1, member 2 [Pecten maximus]|uniref:cholesterol 25-hydroxylase-like protein 1, member 2 n=1 Tax=Pecten maximus TaxID=6579 RepID=UPI001458BB68|nr:cholesterol 25-hydroxylase-like protein 1, member 2 [Pecten maximus]
MDSNLLNIGRTWMFINESLADGLLLWNTSGRSSGRILQAIWDLRLGREEFLRSPLFPVFLSVVFYFSFCTPFMIIDLIGKKWTWMQSFKLQTNKDVTLSQIFDTLGLTFWNHIVYILPAAVSQWIWTPDTELPELAPSMFEFVWHQIASLLVFDFQYFVWHWSHHRFRFLYKHIHAVHHRYHSPFCWVTQYLHPWELITVGFLTTTNTWFFNCHPLTIWSYMIVSIIVSVEAHIGFDFPFCLHNWFPFGVIGGAPKHDMHHLKPMTNFQPFFNHWDKLFATFCPAMQAGGVKPKTLLEYEHKHKETKKIM